MKGKILALLFFVFFGLFLVGCDFFGGGTTTFITTAATTTAGDTSVTTAETTAITTAGTTTGATAVTTTAATAGTTTTALTTAVTTATTTVTTVPTTTATTTVSTTATTTATTTTVTTVPTTTVSTESTETSATLPEEVTVTFLNEDGTILLEAVIAYGGDVTPPAGPSLSDTSHYRYTFVYWDHDLTGITENMVVRPVYDVEYLDASGEFDRADLIALIQMMTEDELTEMEIEEEIDMYLYVLGIFSEEHLYQILSFVTTKFGELQTIDNAEDFNTWVAELTGNPDMDDEFVVNTLMHMLSTMIANSYEYFDISYIDDDIAYFQNRVDENQIMMDGIRSDVVNYCTTSTSMPSECIAYYDASVQNLNNYFMEYDRLYNDYFRSVDFEGSERYQELQELIDQYFYYTYEDINLSEAAAYLSDYNGLLLTLNPDEYTAYMPILNAFWAYLLYEDTVYYPLEDSLDGIIDTTGDHRLVKNQIVWYFGDYQNLFWDNQNWHGEINNSQQERARMLDQHRTMSIFYGYLQTPGGLANIRELVEDLYTSAKELLTTVDSDLFDLVMEIMHLTMNLEEDENPDLSFLLTPENLAFYIPKFVDILEFFQTKFDTGAISIDNLVTIGEDILTRVIQSQDMTETEKALILSLALPKVEEYVTMALDEFDNLINFLNSIDVVKVEAILDFVKLFAQNGPDGPDMSVLEDDGPDNYVLMIWTIANFADVMLGDGSLDLSMIVDDVINLYYDITTQFEPDEVLKASVKAAANLNIARLLELSAIIGAYNPVAIGVDGVIAMEEFMARGQALAGMFSSGFESILEPIEFGYTHQAFVDLVQNMSDGYLTEEEADQKILDLMGILNETDEETAYYLLQTLMLQVMSVTAITSFSDVQAWVAGFDNYGYTRPEMAQCVVNFIIYNFTKQLAPGGHFDTEKDYYENWISNYEDMIIEDEGHIQDIENTILFKISGLNQTLIDNYMIYWHVMTTEVSMLADINILVSDMMYSSDIFDYDTYFDLTDCLEDIYIGYKTQDDFDLLWNQLRQEEQELYQDVIDLLVEYSEWKTLVYDPLMDSFVSDLYQATGVNEYYWNAIEYYEEFYYDIQNLEKWIDENNESLEYLAIDKARAEMILDYLDDPDNLQLTIDVMLVAADEITNLVNTANSETFDTFMELIMGSMNFGLRVMSEEPEIDGPNIDLSPEAVLGYIQDISAVIGTLFSTIDATDEANIKAFAIDMLEIQFLAEGQSQVEVDLKMVIINLAINKYFDRVRDVLDIVAVTLDGISLEELNTFVALAPNLFVDNASMAQIIIGVSTLIDILCYDETLEVPDTFDYETIFNYAVELYFDIMYMFDYEELDMTDLQTIVLSHVEDLLAYAYEIASFDPMNLTDENYATIFELYKYGEWIGQNIQNPEGLVYPLPISLLYEHQDFVNLIISMYGEEITEEQIGIEIQNFIDLFEVEDEEAAYYRIMLLGSFMRNLPEMRSFYDVLDFYRSLRGIGFSNEDLATYLINFAISRLNMAIADNSDEEQIEAWEQDILDFEVQLAYYEDDVAQIDADVAAEIALLAITNSGAAAIAEQMYNQGIYRDMVYSFWNSMYHEGFSHEEFYFDSERYFELELYWAGNMETEPNIDAFNYLYDSLRQAEKDVYMPILNAASNYWNAERQYVDLWNNLNSYIVVTSELNDFGYYIDWQRGDRLDSQHWAEMYSMWIEEAQDNIERTSQGIMMLSMFDDFFSDPDNVILAKATLALLMNRLDAVLEDLTKEDFMILNKVFSNYYFDFNEFTTPEEILEKMQNLMILFGPIFFDASGTSNPGSQLNTFLSELISSYATVFLPDEGWTIEDFRLDVTETVVNFIDQMYLVNEFDLLMLTETDYDEIMTLITYIQDFGGLFSQNETGEIE